MKALRLLALFLPILATACAGSAYQLPMVTNEEVTIVEEKLEADNSDLKVFKRSDANYRSRLAKISKRLQRSAVPLCEQAGYMPCDFKVEYSNEDTVNAYAHNENEIIVFKGLLKYLKNDHEIAALVGHEMGHHIANHIKETQKNAATGAAVSGILSAVLIGAANANNPYYNAYNQQRDQQTIENMMIAGAEIGSISFSKEQEREADLLGAYLVEHAGYNLDKAQNLLYTMSRISGDEVLGQGNTKAALLDTHPPTPERVVAWRKAINEIEGNETKLPYPKAK